MVQVGRNASHSVRRRRGVRVVPIVVGIAGLVVLLGSLRVVSSRGSGGLAGRLSPGIAKGYSILLVTLDTVRADHLGCYGNDRAATPVIDGLAAQGVRFADAVTSVPLTVPSHSTMLTGRYPPQHGVRNNGDYRLPQQETTLAEVLRDRGYATAAFVGSFVLDARFGCDQGFETYDFKVSAEGYRPQMPDFNERSARQVTDAAVDWVGKLAAGGPERPFLLWVHYFDAHLPYHSPLQDEPRFAGRPYDAEIAFIDQELGRLLQTLGRRNLRERTLVVVVSDHGEALGEHGEPTHGLLLYEPTVRVPFILSCPGLIPKGLVIDSEVVGLADLRPTLEDLLGLWPDAPSRTSAGAVDGVSLLRKHEGRERAIYLETREPLELAGWSPLHGLRTHGAVLIDSPNPRLFDLARDPSQTRNLYAAPPSDLAGLAGRLQAMSSSWTEGGSAARVMSEEEMERLESLGYLRSSGTTPQGARPDPEAMLPVYRKSLEAERLYGAGEYEKAARLAREVVDQSGEFVQSVRVLAFSEFRLGHSVEAVAILERAAREHSSPFLVRSLAQLLILDADYAQARKVLDRYENLDGSDGRVDLLRGDCLAKEGRLAEAVERYRSAALLDSNRVGIQAGERIRAIEEKIRRPHDQG